MSFNRTLYILLFPFWFLLLISIASCKHQNSQDKTDSTFTARIAFNDSIYDFGTFSLDSAIRKHTFSFVNIGDIPAVILNVNPSCRCISAKYTQEAIRPGKSGKIEVIFDGTESTNGYFNKSIRIRINSSNVYILHIKGSIK